jgi:hypothetical protein
VSRVAYLKREAFDNIAVGSVVSTQERVLPDASGSAAGVTPPAKDRTTFVHGENLCGVGNTSTVLERVISGNATATGERPGGA